jgi:sRNA-binding regulator protein Hfq
MMLTVAQEEFLNELIAEEGIYFEIIREDTTFDLGTKILYLERAISQGCEPFNQFLDKLYNPDLVGELGEANIEFIRAFKVINDFCFNNKVKYGEFGVRDALTHYFSMLGDGVDAEGFRVAVQEKINARIDALNAECEEKVIKEEQEARKAAEQAIARQTGWRKKIDLPSNQLVLAELPRVLARVLSEEEYQQLSVELRQVIADNPESIRDLIQGQGLSFEQLQSITANKLTLLVNHRHIVTELLSSGVSLQDLIELDDEILTLLVNHRKIVTALLRNGVPLQDIIELDEVKLTLLGNHIFDVAKYTTLMTLQELLGLDERKLTVLLNNPDSVTALLSSGMTSQDIMGVDYKTLTLLVDHRNIVTRLLRNTNITLQDLIALDSDKLNLLLKDRDSATVLLYNGMTLQDIIEVDYEILTLLVNHIFDAAELLYYDEHTTKLTVLLNNPDSVTALLRNGVPFQDLFDEGLDEDKLTVLLNDSDSVITLLEDDVPFEELTALPLEDLITALSNTKEEPEETSNASSSSLGPGMF